ncbi:hypothetical protein MVI27_09850 [Chryseobacterium salipaludis]|uniref:hypothetical protein n=1 Tax=Chryseobacterium TaxID=59732 RepID=UPI001FF34C84|nr:MULTISPECIES: hypothetical protein [Chryseobacterium]MCJ8498564.1 hypothetical protein [Chryseobacterium salipaludis]MCX3297111.1 hypothetical protein [Planobacterium sp. JC490]
MERIILKFNEAGYMDAVQELQEKADNLNNALQDFQQEYELKLTDKQIHAHFIDSEPVAQLAATFYPETKSPTIRAIAQEAAAAELRHIQELHGITYQREKFSVKKGAVAVLPETLEALRSKFEESLDTPRAKQLYDLHQEAFEKVSEIMAMIKGTAPRATFVSLFQYDKDFILKKQEVNYNAL